MPSKFEGLQKNFRSGNLMNEGLEGAPPPIEGIAAWWPVIVWSLGIVSTVVASVWTFFWQRRDARLKKEEQEEQRRLEAERLEQKALADQDRIRKQAEEDRRNAEFKQMMDTRLEQSRIESDRIQRYQDRIEADVIRIVTENTDLRNRLSSAMITCEKLEGDLKDAIEALASKDARIVELERKVTALEAEVKLLEQERQSRS